MIYAEKWRKSINLKDIFDGLSPNPTDNFILNFLNQYVSFKIPKKFQTPYLHWKDVFPEGQLLLDNFDDIRKEALNVLKGNIPRFDEIDPSQELLAKYGDKKWSTFIFRFYDDYNIGNCKKCPKTTKVLKKLNVNLAMFSVMERGKQLFPHKGPWKGIIRIHLGLIIPKGSELIVENIKYEWKEKEIVAFDDTYYHSVNNPNGTRVILFLDVDRKHIDSEIHEYVKSLGKDYLYMVNKNIEEKSSHNS